MTVSEKAHGMAKSGLTGGGVLERGKYKKTTLPTCLCVLRRLGEVAKHRLGSWSKREKSQGGE